MHAIPLWSYYSQGGIIFCLIYYIFIAILELLVHVSVHCQKIPKGMPYNYIHVMNFSNVQTWYLPKK